MAKYFKLRYTYPDDLQDLDNNEFANQVCDFNREHVLTWLDKIGAADYVFGVEQYNKLGEPTKRHIHIHFTSEKDISTIRRWLTRYWKDEMEDQRTRAALYSLVEENDVKDIERFFRYPLKQRSVPIPENHRSLIHQINVVELCPVHINGEKHRLLAHEEWKNLVDVYKKKQETNLSKDSTYDKYCKWVSKNNIQLSSYQNVRDSLIQFYIENDMAINVNTIAGYVVTYGIKHGLIDKEKIEAKLDKIIFG